MMNQTALELALYLGNTELIMKWLEDEGVKTQEDAKAKLFPLVQNNVTRVQIMGGTLAGTSNTVDKIINHFNDEC